VADQLRQLSRRGGSTITHQESSFPFSATRTKALNSSQNFVEMNIFDGLGRVSHHEITSDPQGTVYTDTTYDALGRSATVSNPYRTTGDSTYGTTTNSYDALSRPISVTKPDGSKVATAYCGPTVLVTDEANHWRRSTKDALGRLVEVDEPNSLSATVTSNGCPGGADATWVTAYAYDALDDLTSVVQSGSRNRSFVYDALGHLTSSTNPETSTITYGYDADGNLTTKKDARGITTTYSYDTLNRLTGKTYSNGDPSVSYAYDQSACIGQSPCYNVGRRTTMTDAGGAETLSYDKMGSEWGEQRTTNAVSKTTTYTYDLAGNLAALTYPSGRTITYTYDSAGRPSDAIDAADGINYVTGSCTNGASSPSTGTCYAPHGAVAQINNGTNLVSTYIYNDRLQPCWMYATTGAALATNTACTASAAAGNILDLKYNFNLGSGDNGNVMGIANNRDTTRSQSFTYDQVSRVLSGQTSATTGPNCWGETFNYDQWANLLSIGGVSGYTGCTQENLSVSAAANNQIAFSGISYDASGNMLGDGANSYSYNAESQMSAASGVNYTYDGDGNRLEKSSGKIYWYGAGGNTLNESDLSGSFTNEYVFFAGKRVARWDLASANPVSPGTGAATLGGSEQSTQVKTQVDTAGTGTVTISGTEQSLGGISKVCHCWVGVYDSGTVTITVNGHADTVNYGQGSTSSSIASGFANVINGDSAASVTASANGSTVTLTAKTTSSATNYSLSASSATTQGQFSSPSFAATPSGSALTGGQDAVYATVYDSGSVWVTVNGFQAATNYGQGSTAASVLSAIANVFNTNGASPVTASVSGSTLALTATTAGASTNYSLSCGSSTTQGSLFSPSFTTSCGPRLTGGRDAFSGNLYYYSEDLLGSSRTLVQAGQTSPCYDADFYPFGGERVVTSTCPQNYKFTGKERDAETGLDYFGARYYSNGLGRWLTPDKPFADQIAHRPQSWNLYAYGRNNPLGFSDSDGRSTHTARDGTILAVYDDGDLGVYEHDDIAASADWDKSQLAREGKGVNWMGVTEFWDEFRDHDPNTGAIMPGVPEGAKIIFGYGFDDLVTLMHDLTKYMSLDEIQQDEHPGKLFDIKTIAPEGPYTGGLLNGKYVTARSAGNYLAGLNAATGTQLHFHISFETFMKMAGALHVLGKLDFATAARIAITGKEYGPAPWYGEIEYAGRMAKEGFDAGRPPQ
jgi:RHS repeat-associated protein